MTNDEILKALKACAEPTRLRLLALLQRGDLSVGECVDILDQSQPRLSHHLKSLAQAGLIDRLPEGSWIFYRLSDAPAAANLQTAILSSLDLTQPPYADDRSALEQVRARRAASAARYFSAIAEDWDHLRALHFPSDAIERALLDLAGPRRFSKHIDLGTGTGRMLCLFAPQVSEAEGLDLSHHMLTVARANLARDGISHASVRQGDVCATPFEPQSADLMTIHQVLHFLSEPAAVLREAARLLRPGGQLLIVDFAPHSLDFLREKQGHRRLGIRDSDMQAWCRDLGLSCAPVRRFEPPAGLDQGLCVLIWSITRPALSQERAA